MVSEIYTVTVDCADPQRLAAFWGAALGYVEAYDEGDEVCIESKDEGSDCAGLLFIKVPDTKRTKNRIHFDLNCTDQESEVERLMHLGATPVDIGQRDVDWVVLADPEGNEFCVLSPRGDGPQ